MIWRISRRYVNGTALASKLINCAKNFSYVQRIASRLDGMFVLVLLDVLEARIKVLIEVQITRIHMVENSSRNFTKLPPVQLSRLPVTLNKSAL